MELAILGIGLIMLLGICAQAVKGKRKRRHPRLRSVRRGR